jgi:iron(III) transport system ATP-binding protein
MERVSSSTIAPRPLTITLEAVTVGPEDAPILQAAELVLQAGKLTALLGPSGAGKTTMLKVLAGLERPRGGRVSAGSIIWSDATTGIFVEVEQREIGMVFQSYALWPHMTVFENIAFPLRVRGLGSGEIAERVKRVLDLVRLPDEKALRRPGTLSGGEQQRVGLARALVYEPKLLLLDEPLANLDGPGREAVRAEIRELQKRTGITTLYVTHDQAEALAVADSVAVMDRGRVIECGSPRSVYERPRTAFSARFFGARTSLPGTFHATARAVEIGGNLLQIQDELADFEDGSTVEVLSRQEDFELIDPENGAGWAGQVVSADYGGETVHCAIETALGRLRVAVPSIRPVNVGDHVRATLKSGRLKVFETA